MNSQELNLKLFQKMMSDLDIMIKEEAQTEEFQTEEFQAGLKSYAAEWLKEQATILRDESGRFASHASGQAQKAVANAKVLEDLSNIIHDPIHKFRALRFAKDPKSIADLSDREMVDLLRTFSKNVDKEFLPEIIKGRSSQDRKKRLDLLLNKIDDRIKEPAGAIKSRNVEKEILEGMKAHLIDFFENLESHIATKNENSLAKVARTVKDLDGIALVKQLPTLLAHHSQSFAKKISDLWSELNGQLSRSVIMVMDSTRQGVEDFVKPINNMVRQGVKDRSDRLTNYLTKAKINKKFGWVTKKTKPIETPEFMYGMARQDKATAMPPVMRKEISDLYKEHLFNSTSSLDSLQKYQRFMAIVKNDGNIVADTSMIKKLLADNVIALDVVESTPINDLVEQVNRGNAVEELRTFAHQESWEAKGDYTKSMVRETVVQPKKFEIFPKTKVIIPLPGIQKIHLEFNERIGILKLSLPTIRLKEFKWRVPAPRYRKVMLRTIPDTVKEQMAPHDLDYLVGMMNAVTEYIYNKKNAVNLMIDSGAYADKAEKDKLVCELIDLSAKLEDLLQPIAKDLRAEKEAFHYTTDANALGRESWKRSTTGKPVNSPIKDVIIDMQSKEPQFAIQRQDGYLTLTAGGLRGGGGKESQVQKALKKDWHPPKNLEPDVPTMNPEEKINFVSWRVKDIPDNEKKIRALGVKLLEEFKHSVDEPLSHIPTEGSLEHEIAAKMNDRGGLNDILDNINTDGSTGNSGVLSNPAPLEKKKVTNPLTRKELEDRDKDKAWLANNIKELRKNDRTIRKVTFYKDKKPINRIEQKEKVDEMIDLVRNHELPKGEGIHFYMGTGVDYPKKGEVKPALAIVDFFGKPLFGRLLDPPKNPKPGKGPKPWIIKM